MTPKLPQVVVSRDGQRAVLFESIGTDLRSPSRFDGFHVSSTVRLRPRGDRFFVNVRVSDTFRAMWNAKGQTLRWDADFDTALPDLALIALGRFLDGNAIPNDPVDGEDAFTVTVSSDLFDIFTQPPASDQDLHSYVRGKIYWAWRFNTQPTAFVLWEARRLRVDLADFHQAAFPDIGSLWERTGATGYTALPALVRESPSTGRGSGTSIPIKPAYDVALSFAGEQRVFVSAVATALKNAGAAVFYDEFADLWGKDLTKELERVYRTDSRFVVIFISRAYVEKAWPNLERQHALAGRIERMDDSVLPARFDPIDLPGLPITVGYLDIGARTPNDIAELVLSKLR